MAPFALSGSLQVRLTESELTDTTVKLRGLLGTATAQIKYSLSTINYTELLGKHIKTGFNIK